MSVRWTERGEKVRGSGSLCTEPGLVPGGKEPLSAPRPQGGAGKAGEAWKGSSGPLGAL